MDHMADHTVDQEDHMADQEDLRWPSSRLLVDQFYLEAILRCLIRILANASDNPYGLLAVLVQGLVL